MGQELSVASDHERARMEIEVGTGQVDRKPENDG